MPLETTPAYPDIVMALHCVMGVHPTRLHWLIYVTKDHNAEDGYKFHATNLALSWQYEMKEFKLKSSKTVVVAAVIGSLGSQDISALDALLRHIPMEVPAIDAAREAQFNCRVWAREAARRMHDAGMISCPDVNALEEEMQGYGNKALDDLKKGKFTQAKLRIAKNSTTPGVTRPSGLSKFIQRVRGLTLVVRSCLTHP